MLFDSHSHIQFSAYNQDRDKVIERAQKAGVKMIAVGTNLKTSKEAIEIAEKHPDDIWATIGIHPNEIENCKLKIENLRMLAKHPRVVAIGECGLDYFRNPETRNPKLETRKLQREVFIQQIKLAEELKKPLMIHCRPSKGIDDAYEDLIEQFSIFNFQFSKIVHFYAGSLEMAKKLLELGCYFTFGGVITFSRDFDEIIKFLPLENIMIETDAPYVAPEPHRGQRNEPAYVIEVAKKLAEIKKIGYDEVIEKTSKNAKKIFKI